MRLLSLLLGLCVAVGLAACGGDDDDDDATADGVPAAPTGLDAMAMGDGLHVSWRDQSDDEDEFVIERADGADGEFAEIAREPANAIQHHDGPLNTGTYSYRVSAVNAHGSSAAVEGTFEMP